MRVLFAGTPDVAVPTLRALAARHTVVAALTRPPARRSRRGAEEPSPVADAARELGIDVLEWPTLRTPEAVAAIEALELDVAVVVAYGALVPATLLDVPTHGWINLHFSLLPAWRGAAPVQWAVRSGDEITGATTFRLTTGLDTGPVIGTMTEGVRPRDTSGDLLDRLSVAGVPLVLASLDALADGSASPTEQPDDGVSLAPKLEVAHAQVPWHLPAVAVDRFVRSMTPAPGAWTVLAGTRVKVGPVVLVPVVSGASVSGEIALAPGEVRAGKNEVHVGTGTTPVLLGEVAPAGKAWMPAAAWARGARLEQGSAFEGVDRG
ncbi:methionyl-tRNA formyltransferase [Serinibacter arcticus]|uniref:Methionyl-tRNA formyltransferase n=1 Tax=Serinibacter arcticus TaxID=1655435 RepID=A0A2U1ZZC4_9MICO|nr:methionyl-tRNA formyltransferase [Serinibacter arcticus]PWD52300.1 methionyl-tRNA formyltransferase [Serinibacter arcticus]